MRSFIFILLLLPLVGCAAVENAGRARKQNIVIETPYAEGARCSLSDARGRTWKVRNTPGNVAVDDGHAPLQIICKKDGYKTTTEMVNESKEELLTIDGERVSFGLYEQFPQRTPRLVPNFIKETSSFIIDPTGNISAKYPDKIVVWMEPEKWESEDAKREWAFEKEVWKNEMFIVADDAEIKDEARKNVRREKKKEREERFHRFKEKTKYYAKKAVDGETYGNIMRGGTMWVGDTAGELTYGVVDSAGIAIGEAGTITKNVAKKAGGMGAEAARNVIPPAPPAKQEYKAPESAKEKPVSKGNPNIDKAISDIEAQQQLPDVAPWKKKQ